MLVFFSLYEVNEVSEVNASLEVLPSGQAQAENDNRYDR